MDADTNFTVVGDGGMGTACALLLAKKPGRRVTVWCHLDAHRAEIEAARENKRFLPGVPLPPDIRFTSEFASCRDAAAFVLAVPTIYLADVLQRLQPLWPAGTPVVSVIKG